MESSPEQNRECHLQKKLGISEECSPGCMYYERSVGCLFERGLEAVDMPAGVARQLLRTAHRQTKPS